jgi:hypothetical protein
VVRCDDYVEGSVSQQEPLTIVAAVRRSNLPALSTLLGSMGKNAANNSLIPFGRLAQCHFGRLFVWAMEHDLEGASVAPELILIADCDGEADRFLADLVDVAGSGIDLVFQHCEGYPAAPVSRAQRIEYLQRRRVRTPANYVHRPGRTLRQIHGEQSLHNAIQRFLESARFEHLTAVETRARILAFVEHSPSLRWALAEPPRPALSFRIRETIHAAALPLGLLWSGPVVVPATLLLLLLIRMRELRDPSPHIRPSEQLVDELNALEDHAAHNCFTAAGLLKPGLVRRVTIATVLQLIGYGTRHLFTRDSLAGVKTIHFARWIALDGGRRVIFASNYDGSMEAYNDDFIDLVWWGLNLVFGNGYEYPRTRFLVFGGAKREQEFKDYLRRLQIPTPVWYSAYPEMTARHIQKNAAIRAGLRGRMNEREAQTWLRIL